MPATVSLRAYSSFDRDRMKTLTDEVLAGKTTTVTSVVSAEPTTVTGSPTTVVVTSTKTSYRVLPTLCDPVNFKDYRNFVDRRRFDYKTVPGTTKQECCLT